MRLTHSCRELLRCYWQACQMSMKRLQISHQSCLPRASRCWTPSCVECFPSGRDYMLDLWAHWFCDDNDSNIKSTSSQHLTTELIYTERKAINNAVNESLTGRSAGYDDVSNRFPRAGNSLSRQYLYSIGTLVRSSCAGHWTIWEFYQINPSDIKWNRLCFPLVV